MRKRFRSGRLSVYLESRDVWIGVYVGRDALYVCPLPTVVFKWNTSGCEYEQHAERVGCSCSCHEPWNPEAPF